MIATYLSKYTQPEHECGVVRYRSARVASVGMHTQPVHTRCTSNDDDDVSDTTTMGLLFVVVAIGWMANDETVFNNIIVLYYSHHRHCHRQHLRLERAMTSHVGNIFGISR